MLREIAYFNNAATTYPKPECVYSALDQAYRTCIDSLGRSSDGGSGKYIVSTTRDGLLELNDCPNKQVIFTPTATEALNVILRGVELPQQVNVYITPFEHNAVTRTLNYLSKRQTINIHQLAFNKEIFSYDLEGISKQFIKQPPQLLVMTHASNVCGYIAPILEIATLAKKYNAINVVDMAQTMGLIKTSLRSEVIDYAVFAGHKTLYAPFGISGFICSQNPLLQPLLYGGTGIESASLELPKTVPERFEVGSQNIPAILGLKASLEWIKEVGIEQIRAKEQENHRQLLEGLSQFKSVRIIPNTDEGNLVGVVSCLFERYSADEIGKVLFEQGVIVRTGLHCSPQAHQFLGTFPQGTVRFSVSYFNSEADFIILKKALQFIQENG